MNKPGAPRGNNNAMKGNTPKLTRIQFRCTSEQKASFIQSAQAEGLPLTEWIIKTLEGNLKQCISLDADIKELGLVLRTVNCLNELGITSVNELIRHSKKDLFNLSNKIGLKSMAEIEEKLSLYALSLAKS